MILTASKVIYFLFQQFFYLQFLEEFWLIYSCTILLLSYIHILIDRGRRERVMRDGNWLLARWFFAESQLVFIMSQNNEMAGPKIT